MPGDDQAAWRHVCQWDDGKAVGRLLAERRQPAPALRLLDLDDDDISYKGRAAVLPTESAMPILVQFPGPRRNQRTALRTDQHRNRTNPLGATLGCPEPECCHRLP